MKNKILIIGLVLLIILATSITVLAITGITQTAQDESEDTWEKFRDEMFENKKAFIEERVKDGTLTQEEADEILKNIELMQEYCLGAGGCGMGRGFGMMRNRLGNNSGYGNYGFRGMGFGGGRCGRGSW